MLWPVSFQCCLIADSLLIRRPGLCSLPLESHDLLLSPTYVKWQSSHLTLYTSSSFWILKMLERGLDGLNATLMLALLRVCLMRSDTPCTYGKTAKCSGSFSVVVFLWHFFCTFENSSGLLRLHGSAKQFVHLTFPFTRSKKFIHLTFPITWELPESIRKAAFRIPTAEIEAI